MDYDDPERERYPEGYCSFAVGTGDPCQPLNFWAKHKAYERAAVVGFLGDDSRLETVGWDEKIAQALETPGFAWGMDGTNANPWPSTCFISKKIVDALGYMVPPTLRRGFFDVAWVMLAEATGTKRIVDAMFRHDNSAGDPRSPNYLPERQVPPSVIASDERAFNEWKSSQFPRDVQRLRRVLYI